MPKQLILLAFLAVLTMGSYSQRSTVDLTFTAVENTAYVQLDSIKIMNRTQGGETMIYWPDTTLSLDINPGDLLLCVGYATFPAVSIPEMNNDPSAMTVDQNFPNPLGDQSEISMFIPQAGSVNIMITDLQGKVVLRTERQLDEGHHSFRFMPGESSLYILTIAWNGISRSIKMISSGPNKGKTCSLDYIGGEQVEPALKASGQTHDLVVRQSGLLDSPVESTNYTFQFGTNIPCPGTPTVEYEGQVYNTIQIFSQCWLKENLNVGVMIFGSYQQSNNGIIEKYCYDHEIDSCTKYGGLYQWDEVMQYTTEQGTRGICPPGWHLPTDEEWKVLAGAVDSQYGIGDPEWDSYWEYLGYDAGTALKTTSGWLENGNGTDLFGFSGLPGGYSEGGYYIFSTCYSFWWSSTVKDNYNAWIRKLYYRSPGVNRTPDYREFSFNVRCLRDY